MSENIIRTLIGYTKEKDFVSIIKPDEVRVLLDGLLKKIENYIGKPEEAEIIFLKMGIDIPELMGDIWYYIRLYLLELTKYLGEKEHFKSISAHDIGVIKDLFSNFFEGFYKNIQTVIYLYKKKYHSKSDEREYLDNINDEFHNFFKHKLLEDIEKFSKNSGGNLNEEWTSAYDGIKEKMDYISPSSDSKI